MKPLRTSLHQADVALHRFAFWWACPAVKKFRWRLFFAVAILLCLAMLGHVFMLHAPPPAILLLGGPLWYFAGVVMFWFETTSGR